MKRNIIIHYLRNPYGIDEYELRKARLRAADELERLYKFEEEFKTYIKSLGIKNSEDDLHKVYMHEN